MKGVDAVQASFLFLKLNWEGWNTLIRMLLKHDKCHMSWTFCCTVSGVGFNGQIVTQGISSENTLSALSNGYFTHKH
jgi:hypothetical protein